ncbi:MAG: hypothetical protein ACKOEE_14885, partial [Tagaea sp.]
MAAGSLDAEFKLSTAPLAGGGRPLARALAVSIVLHLLLLVFWIGVERRDQFERNGDEFGWRARGIAPLDADPENQQQQMQDDRHGE